MEVLGPSCAWRHFTNFASTLYIFYDTLVSYILAFSERIAARRYWPSVLAVMI